MMNSTPDKQTALPEEPPYISRVVAEKTDLDEKRVKLAQFLASEIFDNLPETEKALLYRQHDTMRTYSSILRERIQIAREREGIK